MSVEAPVRNITWTSPALVDGYSAHGQPPRNPYATGYGAKIPTPYQLRYEGRWHRVYAMCYSNTATHYIRHRGADLVLDTETEYVLECYSRGVIPVTETLAVIRRYSTELPGVGTPTPNN